MRCGNYKPEIMGYVASRKGKKNEKRIRSRIAGAGDGALSAYILQEI